MTTRQEYYSLTSQEYFDRAENYLVDNDLLQASEKGWGAAALKIKSVAASRGWNHRHHTSLQRVIDRLMIEAGDRSLGRYFGSASALHRNFYEGRMSSRRVRHLLSQVGILLQRLDLLY